MKTHDKIDLPPPAGHYYEWDGVYGKRKFTTAPHNGRECDRAVAYYTEDQVRAAIEADRQGQPAASAELRPDYSEMSRETLERHAASMAQALADDKPRAFWERYAIGPKSAPSCICCGRVPDEVAVQHAEIPSIVVCRRCHDAETAPVAQEPDAKAVATAFRDRLINAMASLEDCYLSRESIETAAEDVLHSFTADTPVAAQAHPVVNQQMTTDLLERVSDALGRFVSDEGWGQADMDLADEFNAALAARPTIKDSKIVGETGTQDREDAERYRYLINKLQQVYDGDYFETDLMSLYCHMSSQFKGDRVVRAEITWRDKTDEPIGLSAAIDHARRVEGEENG